MARDPFANMNPVFVQRIKALINASGGRVRPGSGTRSIEEQARLRVKNGCPDVWTSPASSCRVPTAIPGKSNHNHGLAMDLSGDLAWANENAARFGLHFPVRGEDWHVEPIDIDSLRDGRSQFSSYSADVDLPGAVAYNVNFAGEEPRSPEDELAYRMTTVMDIVMGGTPEPIEPDEPPQAPNINQAVAGIAEQGNPVMQNPSLETQGAPTSGGPVQSNDMGEYARQKFGRYGWNDEDFKALVWLWNKESGDPKVQDRILWNPGARNGNAQGLAQKMTSVHGPVESTWQGQIDWGLDYIADRYGSPRAALAHHLRNNSY